MAGAPQQSGGGGQDNGTGILWVVAGIFVLCAIIWYTLKTQIITFYFNIKLFEIGLISHFTTALDQTRLAILSSNPKTMTLNDVISIGNAVGAYLRFPCIALIIALAVIVFLTNSVRTFKRIYSMKDLLQAEQVNWPQVSPVTKLDLIKSNIDQGPWAMAMTPMQFCKRNRLLQEYKRQAVEGMSRKEANRIEVKLLRGQANKIFAMQLGPLWHGPEKLPMHTKALFAIFAARLNGDGDSAAKMLRQLAASANSKLDFTGVEQLLKKHGHSKLVQKKIAPHAYIFTVMASMLVGAREDGVQASADFLWLKPIDRRLWYVLNTVGRQTPFVEVAGIYAHWISEREADRKLLIPMVEEATNALELALKDIIYQPDEAPST